MINQSTDQPRKRSADYQNQLATQPIAQVVESALAEQENAYAGEIDALRARLEAGDTPESIRTHLQSAIRSLEEARQASLLPIKEEIAKAIIGIANHYRLPLQLRSNGEAAAAEARSALAPERPRGRGGNQAFILDVVAAAGHGGIRPSAIRQQAEDQGYNGNSVAQAVNALVRKGTLQKVEDRRDAPVVAAS